MRARRACEQRYHYLAYKFRVFTSLIILTLSDNKRVDTIDTRWKSDGIGNDHIEKLSLLPDPELRYNIINIIITTSVNWIIMEGGHWGRVGGCRILLGDQF